MVRIFYKELSLHDRINYKSCRVDFMHSLPPDKRLRKVTMGVNWDEWKNGVQFENPILGGSNKALDRLIDLGRLDLCDRLLTANNRYLLNFIKPCNI